MAYGNCPYLYDQDIIIAVIELGFYVETISHVSFMGIYKVSDNSYNLYNILKISQYSINMI